MPSQEGPVGAANRIPPSQGQTFTLAVGKEPRHMVWLRGGYTKLQLLIFSGTPLLITALGSSLTFLYHPMWIVGPVAGFFGIFAGAYLAGLVDKRPRYGNTQMQAINDSLSYRHQPKAYLNGRPHGEIGKRGHAVLYARSKKEV